MEKQVNVVKSLINGKPFLQFDFLAHLSESMVEPALATWQNALDELGGGQKLDIIFNCIPMKSFDSEARKRWQAFMKEHKARMGEIWVISENLFILTSARTMGLLAGYAIKSARTIDEVR